MVFIDVSNPASPSVISQFSIDGNVNDFTATGDKLYVITSASNKDVWIYDITNPANPTFVSNNDVANESEGLSIFMQETQTGSTANLLAGSNENELIVVAATTTSQMYVRSRLNLGSSINDIICVEGNLAFLSTSNSNKEFVIVNIVNPDNIVEYASLNFPQQGTGIDFADNKVFMSVKSNDALRIITSGP